MATIDVDLEMYRTSDLVREICERLAENRRISTNDIEKLRSALSAKTKASLPCGSLIDGMKSDHLMKVWGKYSLEEIEKLLSE